MKKRIGYVADYLEKREAILKDRILYVDQEEPQTPYFLVKIEILKYEPNFSHQRTDLNFFRRVIKFFKSKIKIG